MAEQRRVISSGSSPNESRSTAAAGFAGAIIGAGVAVAATRILSNKQTRDKVMDALTEVKKQVMQSVQTIRISPEDGVNIETRNGKTPVKKELNKPEMKEEEKVNTTIDK